MHGKTALLVRVCVGQTDEVLLGFAESHEGSDTEGDHRQTDRGANSAMHVLPIAHFRYGGGCNGDDLLVPVGELNDGCIDVEVGFCTCL